MNIELLQQIQDEFTRRCGRCVVAGGAVRDVLMNRTPKDYDVFVFNDAKPMEKICFDGLELVDSPEWHKSEPYLQATVRWGDAIVQIMSSERKNLVDLVCTFDWNVSAFGFDAERPVDPFFRLGKIESIAPGKKLQLLKVTYPVSTLRRGFRFSERFGMIFDGGDLESLCTMAAGRLIECRLGVTRA